ncbi:Calvin cycle protein CP12, chloroplastic [Porphyridium purpureum]|uniref:Calvin cycle protein CP12, chloroplastic n=1 Tax=Porphyridium purpureum TaxID=35688 RepID=A0A5J4YIM3_PORPP|nr:Calvin cycle protein CP12, chloroplastic [Porphyridium purpureum]|eukprot:POR9084..scf210_14
MAFVTGVAAVGARGVKISDAIKGAEEATSKFGKGSKEAAVAWDTVEELEAEASHQKASNAKKDPLEEYCDDAPEADECRTYDN